MTATAYARKPIGFAVSVDGPFSPETARYLDLNMGRDFTETSWGRLYFWAIPAEGAITPLPNLCDCGLRRGADIELVYGNVAEVA